MALEWHLLSMTVLSLSNAPDEAWVDSDVVVVVAADVTANLVDVVP